ncbi:hypothetical protein D3C81_2051740 [compost metagenome]
MAFCGHSFVQRCAKLYFGAARSVVLEIDVERTAFFNVLPTGSIHFFATVRVWFTEIEVWQNLCWPEFFISQRLFRRGLFHRILQDL